MKNRETKWSIFLSLFILQVGFAQKNVITNKNLETGKYGIISLIVKKDSIFGVFQYYDHYKKELQDYESKNDYYFYGVRKVSNDTIELILSNPYEKQVFGDEGKAYLFFRNDTLSYFQTGLEGMFQPVFFADKINKKAKGYRSKLTEKKDWKEIRFVKSKTAFFYNLPNTQKKRAYLIQYDLVWVTEKRGEWCFIEYYKFDSNKPVIKGWIRELDLYSSDSRKW